MKPSNVVATPVSGVYKPPLTVELDCPSVRVEPISVDMGLNSWSDYCSRNISKVGSTLYFNTLGYANSNNGLGIYDINTNTIANVDCPHSTYSASFIYVNNAVYIIGGYNPVGSVRHNKIMKYANGEVTTLDQSLPETMSRMSCNAIGQYIYIIGGQVGSIRLSTIYRLDTVTDKIELMPYELKVACYRTSSAVYQNRYIYVVGGMEHILLNKIQIIDIEKGSVSFLSKDLPVGIMGSGAMIKDDFLYVFGGADSYYRYTVYKKYLLDESDWELDTQTLANLLGDFGYTSDEKGYYHLIGGFPDTGGLQYQTGRFGVPSSDIEIRYTQTEDGTIPPDPTQADTLYTEPIELTTPTKHNIKAKAFYVK